MFACWGAKGALPQNSFLGGNNMKQARFWLVPTYFGPADRRWRGRAAVGLLLAASTGITWGEDAAPPSAAVETYAVLAYNDLGMHCMNSDFSEMLILPPYNTLNAQVIKRGDGPDVETSDVSVRYFIPDSVHGAAKSNFWRYPTLGPIAPEVGVVGKRLMGTMSANSSRIFEAVGIPMIPTNDAGREAPYSLAMIEVSREGSVVARTQTVVPVSTEMSCNLCHNTPGISTASDILTRHDSLHGTDLMNNRPVLCAACHADNALGAPGLPGVSNLSSAMHTSHASRVEVLSMQDKCYACHPGVRTNCQRDVHRAAGMGCDECHGGMAEVGNPARQPWLEEPSCGGCHTRQGFEFEPPGELFRNARGHGGVHCAACHGSPHAVTPAVTDRDNFQAAFHQGHPGVIDQCTVCHTVQPEENFPHRRDD